MEGCSLLYKERDMTDKIYTDKHGVAITKGAIVSYKDGTRREYIGTIENGDGSFTPQYKTVDQYATGRITRLTSEWANIGGIWSGKVFAKKVPLTELTECEAEWYENWTKSDAYRCM
jgi:hypothetical protein